MAQVNVFYEPETELLTVFWQAPRKEQISVTAYIRKQAEHHNQQTHLQAWEMPDDRACLVDFADAQGCT